MDDGRSLNQPPSKLGRPVREPGDQVYDALLAAAEECLKIHTYRQITVRQVAKIAGVNPSMINYYFNGKKGLYAGLIGHVFAQWKQSLQQIEMSMKNSRFDPVHALVTAVNQCFYVHKSVVALLSYEISQPDSDVREAYLKHHASRSSSAVRMFIETGIQTGHFRRDLQPTFLSFAITALAMHPLSLGDNLSPSFGFSQETLLSLDWQTFLEKTLRHMLC